MRILLRLIFALLLALGVALFAIPARADSTDLRNHLLVVYNKDFSGSEDLAFYYAQKRGIPRERIFGLRCPVAEEIDRKSYEQTILNPLVQFMRNRGWLEFELTSVKLGVQAIQMHTATKNDIRAVVLIRGVPVKISHDAQREAAEAVTRPMFRTNAACVDSELATLPAQAKNISGYFPNAYTYPGYERHFDENDARRMILVTRLDGPSDDDVRAMIDGALQAENERLTGLICIDGRGIKDPKDGYFTGDEWLRGASRLFAQEGFAMQTDDSPPVFADSLPVNQVAFYAGWYADKAQGFFFQPPRRFVPGAIAYHIHSYSGMNVRTTTEQWVGPLIHAGASAVLGSVYEPYLTLMPRPDVLARMLLKGYTFAEAAYSAQTGLSWMITVIGDPLYRPFRVSLSDALQQARQMPGPRRDWLELEQTRKDFLKNPGAFTLASLTQSLVRPDATAVLWEGLADLIASLPPPPGINLTTDIAHSYRKSMSLATEAIDQIRCGLKLAKLYNLNNQSDAAIQLLSVLREKWPDESLRYGVAEELRRLTPSAAPTNAAVPGGAASPQTHSPSPATAPDLSRTTLKPPEPPKPPRPTQRR